ncbi:MAG: phosphoadenosine phosphosulfate reductase family protein [Lachnospiraceae bacterium]|nr:phosphoadenosine phosphosulfate reductase family protein [Lachnospiraceae bacterium]
MEKTIFNVVSFSGGKDSTAMLLKMIEEGIPIDCILFCDTGLEFPQMYEHIDKVERETGLTITRVKPDMDFEYLMFDKPINRKDSSVIKIKYGADQTGNGWPGPKMRWCTKSLKDTPRERFLKAFKPYYEIRYYVGIAADEQKRLERKTNQNPGHIHPLVEWGMTEADCLEYCYSKGYDWGGLYKLFDRVSCWCCPLQPLEDLRKLRANFPELWEQLKEWDDRNFRTFRADYTVRELETRFLFEEERLRMGKTIRGKEFMAALRERFKESCDDRKEA